MHIGMAIETEQFELAGRIPDQASQFSIGIDEKEKIAWFERLNAMADIRHGFSHGQENMAFSRAETPAEKNEVLKRLTAFLESLGIENPGDAITLDDRGECTVASLEALQQTNPDIIVKNERGRFVNVSALFTTQQNIPLVLKVADCYGGLVYANNTKGETVIGLIHVGRRELGALILKESVQFLKDTYAVNPRDIIACFTPALALEHHVIRKNDITRVLGNAKEYWTKYSTQGENGDWYINMESALTEQLENAGILASNTSIDPRNTYISRDFPSHRQATELGEVSGRYALAIEIL